MSSYETDHDVSPQTNSGPQNSLESVIDSFIQDFGPRKSVSQDFLDTLVRIPNKNLAPDDSCCICTVLYREDEYPLVVALPCKGRHTFDLECISKWLQSNSTCPICRANLLEPTKKPASNTEPREMEYDDMYA